MANRDMWVNESIGQGYMYMAIRIVSLGEVIQVELAGLGLGIDVLYAILDILVEDSVAGWSRVDSAGAVGHSAMWLALAKSLVLKHFAHFDLIAESVSLAIDIPEGSSPQSGLKEPIVINCGV